MTNQEYHTEKVKFLLVNLQAPEAVK